MRAATPAVLFVDERSDIQALREPRFEQIPVAVRNAGSGAMAARTATVGHHAPVAT